MPRLRICDGCGTLFEAKAWQVKYGRDKTCPVCTPPDPHHSPEYRAVRRKRMVLANRKCEQCGSTRKLQAHHVDGDPKHHTVANLLILCLRCHQDRTRLQLATQGRRFSPAVGALVPAKPRSRRRRTTKSTKSMRLM